ncbi:hypothetical protein CP556_17625 [Natrinema sp. CBA1119]|nr:hypothetical protein CP556_17625 [Natrinema sp. CBA1119]
MAAPLESVYGEWPRSFARIDDRNSKYYQRAYELTERSTLSSVSGRASEIASREFAISPETTP